MNEAAHEEMKEQIQRLYASIGQIAVLSEHVRHAMENGCVFLLRGKAGKDELAETAMAGHNLESMRRVWVSMMKLAFRGDDATCAMVDHLSGRIDNIAQRRNDTIHRLWYIGLGDEGMKTVRDYRPMPKGRGGVRVTTRHTHDFEEIITELGELASLLWHMAVCVALDVPPRDHFAYAGDKLIEIRGGEEAGQTA